MSGSHRLLVFVHLNKTAGRTLRYILRSSYGARHCDVEPWLPPGGTFSTEELRRVRRFYPRLASIAGHRIVGSVELVEPATELRYLTLVRDPIATCASRFQYQLDYRKKRGLVFEEWIRKEWVRDAQTQRIAGTTNVDDAIALIDKKEMFVGLTERFDESMVLLRALRAPELDINYAPMNVAKSSRVAKDLTADPVTRRMIVEANEADLALYEHVRREVYPALQREYGPTLDDGVAAYAAARRGFNRRNLAMYGLKHRAVKTLLRLDRANVTARRRP